MRDPLGVTGDIVVIELPEQYRSFDPPNDTLQSPSSLLVGR